MPQFLLISDDDAFVERVRVAFGTVGSIRVAERWEPAARRIVSAVGPAVRERDRARRLARTALAPDGRRIVIAIDCRALSAEAASEQVGHVRAEVDDSVLVIGIATLGSERERRTVNITAGIADGVILADREDVGVVLRSLANDRSGTGAYAEAYSLLRTQPGDLDHGILGDVLGSGCAISSVKQLAAHRRCDRGTLLRECRRNGTRSPNDTIELAQAVSAVLLFTAGRKPAGAAAKLVGLEKPDSLAMLVERTFGCPLAWFRHESMTRAPTEVLGALLTQRRIDGKSPRHDG